MVRMGSIARFLAEQFGYSKKTNKKNPAGSSIRDEFAASLGVMRLEARRVLNAANLPVGPVHPAPPTAAPLRYRLQTTVPVNWIPFVPVQIDAARRSTALERAAVERSMDGRVTAVLPVGRGEGWPALPLLCVHQRPEAGLECVPVQVATGRYDRAFRGGEAAGAWLAGGRLDSAGAGRAR